jgi:hypothetical protein
MDREGSPENITRQERNVMERIEAARLGGDARGDIFWLTGKLHILRQAIQLRILEQSGPVRDTETMSCYFPLGF